MPSAKETPRDPPHCLYSTDKEIRLGNKITTGQGYIVWFQRGPFYPRSPLQMMFLCPVVLFLFLLPIGGLGEGLPAETL